MTKSNWALVVLSTETRACSPRISVSPVVALLIVLLVVAPIIGALRGLYIINSGIFARMSLKGERFRNAQLKRDTALFDGSLDKSIYGLILDDSIEFAPFGRGTRHLCASLFSFPEFGAIIPPAIYFFPPKKRLHSLPGDPPPAFCVPVQGIITSGFGVRTDPIFEQSQFHRGIDIADNCGFPVVAAANGRVLFAGYSGLWGKLVVIDHGNGYSTAYAHLQTITVAENDSVLARRQIGSVGTTGKSTGPHLHFEIRKRGVPTDPVKYFTQGALLTE